MAVPQKYLKLGTFWKYYSGKEKAPYPTIFIGGNHEASNYLWELYHGGWVCENIYYLGHAGVINYRGVRIGGLSGIFKQNDYRKGLRTVATPCSDVDVFYKGHYERPPYRASDLRTAYHVRQYDVAKLLQVKSNTLGSLANEMLLTKLQPSMWFSAHLHVKYAAVVDHENWKKNKYSDAVRRALGQVPAAPVANPDEIAIDFSDSDSESTEKSSLSQHESVDQAESRQTGCTDNKEPSKTTRFLSLDKCLPRRDFLQVIDISEPSSEEGFCYDLEWLAITRAMQPYLSVERNAAILPDDEQLQSSVEQELMYLTMQREAGDLDLNIPQNFAITAPPHDPAADRAVHQNIEDGVKDIVNNTGQKVPSQQAERDAALKISPVAESSAEMRLTDSLPYDNMSPQAKRQKLSDNEASASLGTADIPIKEIN
ncbi:lariat debranching enzyme [Apophysomyces sp. BC1034]|nr:lariat debranching enzyme [Apophysomyces sp. BC1034]